MAAVALRRLILLAGAAALPAQAHETGLEATADGWALLVQGCLGLSLGLYTLGLLRLRGSSARLGRHAWAFLCGWALLAAALLGPLDTLGARLFWVHMLQHEILMLACAPLLVLGKPLGVWLWALPETWRSRLGGVSRRRLFRLPWRWLTGMLGAWLLHAAAVWLWHIPPLFAAALQDPGIHALQHASFLSSALLFWWSVLGAGARLRGAGLLSLFTTMLHTGALGALLTFSSTAWYDDAYRDASLAYGLTALEDQQLGGLIMWVPGGLAFFVAALLASARLFRTRPAP